MREVRRADVMPEGEAGGMVLVPVADLGGIDRVGAAIGADQALDPRDRVLQVRARRCGDREGHLLRPVPRLDGGHALCDFVQRRVPGNRLPAGIGCALGRGAPEWRGEPVRVIHQFRRGAALGAQLGAGWGGGLGLRLVAPVDSLVGEQLAVAQRHMDPRVGIARAGLEQQHAALAIGGQAVGQHAAGRAGAGDDGVVSGLVLILATIL